MALYYAKGSKVVVARSPPWPAPLNYTDHRNLLVGMTLNLE